VNATKNEISALARPWQQTFFAGGTALVLANGLYYVAAAPLTERRHEPIAYFCRSAESRDLVEADTDRAYTVQQMASAWRTISQPIVEDDVPLTVDPDDYPLF
jgi:hypothetical protein